MNLRIVKGRNVKENFKKEEIHLPFNKKKIIYRIKIFSPITKELNGLKILHLSDTHFKNKNSSKKEYKILEKIFENQIFDIVIHTGDIIDRDINEFTEEFQNFLKNLDSKYGKYFVFGNHDLYKGEENEIEKIMTNCGFENLTNKSKKITISDKNNNEKKREIFIVGLDDNYKGKPNFKKATKKTKKENFNILITHNLDALKKENIDYFKMIFSGHLHAGEFNFLNYTGVTFLKMIKHYEDINKQIKDFKQIGNETISFSHPANYCGICDKTKIINRTFTKKAGPVIIEFK